MHLYEKNGSQGANFPLSDVFIMGIEIWRKWHLGDYFEKKFSRSSWKEHGYKLPGCSFSMTERKNSSGLAGWYITLEQIVKNIPCLAYSFRGKLFNKTPPNAHLFHTHSPASHPPLVWGQLFQAAPQWLFFHKQQALLTFAQRDEHKPQRCHWA